MTAAIVTATLETDSVGIQKKTTLNALLSSRRAAKNIAKMKIANTQKTGEKRLPTSIPAIASTPVAFDPLTPLNSGQRHTISAMIIAASPLRMPLR